MTINTIDQFIARQTLVSVTPDATIRMACLFLNRHNVGALPVLENDMLKGIISERDVIRRCICEPGALDAMRVEDIMSTNPVTVRRSSTLAEAATLMRKGCFRHLPVVDDEGRAVGMLSLRDIPTEYRLMSEQWDAHHMGAEPA